MTITRVEPIACGQPADERALPAAAVHIAAALPQIAWGPTLTNAGLAEDVTTRPVRIDRGFVEVSDRPGLGIDVDEERVRRHQRDVAPRQVA